MDSPPKGFVDLATAHRSMENSMRSFVGVVVDIMPATMTRNGDYMMTFKVMDPSMRDAIDNSGLRVRYFRKDPNVLPQIRQCGDIVLMKNIKMSRFQEETMALSNLQTQTVVFPVASVPEPSDPTAYKKPLPCLGSQHCKPAVESPEHAYIVQLKHEMQPEIECLPTKQISAPQSLETPPDQTLPTIQPGKPRQSDSSFGRKFKLIKDLRHRDFADICVQVVKKFPGFRGCELYITDYTENKDMFFYAPPELDASEEREGDEYGYTAVPKRAWPGPYGFLVLKVNTTEPHSTYANDSVNEGDIILLQNVRMKIRTDVTKLQGDMWPHQANPDRVQISKSMNINNSPEAQALLARRERYWAARKAKAQANEEGEKKKLTRTEIKRLRKERNKANATTDEQQEKSNGMAKAQPVPTNAASQKELNPHVRCGHQEVPISTIRTILDPDNKRHTCEFLNGTTQILPFVNAKYRARVRVIDFYPQFVEDFSIPSDDPMLGPLTNSDSSQNHEWAFSLLLQDTTKPKPADGELDTMWVTVDHKEGQHLFGNNVRDPTNLRTDQALLSKVKQQLCILWGNLEEKEEDEDIKNRPFECCLMEYGVEMDDDDPEKAATMFGYKRVYAMFGTTVL